MYEKFIIIVGDEKYLVDYNSTQASSKSDIISTVKKYVVDDRIDDIGALCEKLVIDFDSSIEPMSEITVYDISDEAHYFD